MERSPKAQPTTSQQSNGAQPSRKNASKSKTQRQAQHSQQKPQGSKPSAKPKTTEEQRGASGSTIGKSAGDSEWNASIVRRLRTVIDDESAPHRQVIEAASLLRKIEKGEEEDERTLNRLSRDELEALAARLAAREGI